MKIQDVREYLVSLHLPDQDLHHLPPSPRRFSDGASYRIEIPSVEGPHVLQAVLEAANEFGVTVHRVSQGTGITLLSDADLDEMARLGSDYGIEVSLFVGPRAAFDTGAQARASGGSAGAMKLRGMDQVVYAALDVFRAVQHGIRGVLVADDGLLWLLGQMRRDGLLPHELVIKASVSLGGANPVSILRAQDAGADTYNIPSDLELAEIAAIRAVAQIPVDLYVEAPDDLGGFVRIHEVAEITRVAAPVYLKFGLRNAPNIYPSGLHLEHTAILMAREKVRRASIAVGLLQEAAPDLPTTRAPAADLAIPITQMESIVS